MTCIGGVGLDACGCCQHCMKVDGEECGGPWSLYGKCDRGLECRAKNGEERNFNDEGRCSEYLSILWFTIIREISESVTLL